MGATIYGRELARRGLRSGAKRRFGSLDPSQLTPLHWLDEVRILFPRSVYETSQTHALDLAGQMGAGDDALYPQAGVA